MTMIALARFSDADIVLADSRVSWGTDYCQDTLHKIFRIDLNKAIAFSGNVKLAVEIFNSIYNRQDKNGNPSHLEKSVLQVPRISKNLYNKHSEPIQLIMGGYNSKGAREWFKFSYPQFAAQRISSTLDAIGSGKRVVDFIDPCKLSKLETEYPELQLRTTVLISMFDKALRGLSESSVGGMLQVVSFYDGLCHPISYGNINFDPNSKPYARHIYFDHNQQWVQHNAINNNIVPLKSPSKIVTEQPLNKRFMDYVPKKPPII